MTLLAALGVAGPDGMAGGASTNASAGAWGSTGGRATLVLSAVSVVTVTKVLFVAAAQERARGARGTGRSGRCDGRGSSTGTTSGALLFLTVSVAAMLSQGEVAYFTCKLSHADGRCGDGLVDDRRLDVGLRGGVKESLSEVARVRTL